jgi:dTDP-4-amino-4,6-dideoxygalactose transaminase
MIKIDIPFNKPLVTGKEIEYIKKVIANQKLSGDGSFTKKCSNWFEENFGCKKALLTTSCTHALEMAALLADIKPGDEVIMPSYTFVSTANAFVLRGAKIVFVDIRPDTMNMDETLIEAAITEKTKAIVPVHYAGVACEMDVIMSIACRYGLIVIEDAAQGVMSKYKSKYLGTIGHMGCYSFHETKNYNCGEGGALIINDEAFIERAEIIREKGTNRSKFYRGQVDKYTWVDIGSSYLPSELNAAYLYAQLEMAEVINKKRLEIWDYYFSELKPLQDRRLLELPYIPKDCQHNAHMFYIKTKSLDERSSLINYLKCKGINTVFHYVPLHSSPAGKEFGKFCGKDRFTTIESERLLRLPMFYGLNDNKINFVLHNLGAYYEGNK